MFRAVAIAFVLFAAVCRGAENIDDLLAEETPVARAVPAKSEVFVATTSRAIAPGFAPVPGIVQQMVDALVLRVTGKSTVREAWLSLVSAEDIVGIKVAAGPGEAGGTRPAVARAIARGLQAAGIPPARIIVWDRNREDLLAAGYSERDPDFELEWIDPTSGYDREAMITAPVLGRLVWGDSRFGEREGERLVDRLSSGAQLSSTSFYASVLSRKVTKVVNVPSLCDSFMTGVNGAIANVTLWNVDNWRRFTKEPNFGDPFLAEIYADPMVRDKVVLTIMDGLALQFAGGPFPHPNFVRETFSLYASRDPVAIDATAVRLIDTYRVANKLPPIAETASHVETAAQMRLGNAAAESVVTTTVSLEE